MLYPTELQEQINYYIPNLAKSKEPRNSFQTTRLYDLHTCH